MAKILLTTANPEVAAQLKAAFEPDDQVEFVSGPQDVEAALEGSGVGEAALIVTDAPSETLAHSFVRAASRESTGVPIIAVFDESEVISAGLPIRLGFDDYFVQPIDPEEVALVTRRSIGRKHLQDDLGIVGSTEAIHEVIDRIALVAPVGSTVLITGESGVGKELVARGLQKLSPRRGRPFIAVNIAALPETLLESELFGHEKGAFTGAASLRKGMFELADRGTIFLDEVSEMPLGPQTKLLRAIEEKEFMRVGGSAPIKVDVRVIAATNRDLRHAVALGEFRRDLFHRINVLQINIPPLRERREDIPLLVRDFIRRLSAEHHKNFQGITPEAMEMLRRYDWPGNVRELRNLVESMVVLAPGIVIGPEDIPPEVRRGADHAYLPQPVVAHAPRSEPGTAPAAQMEFIFRTLVELKLDMSDLRDQFERYKQLHPELLRHREAVAIPPAGAAMERLEPRRRPVEVLSPVVDTPVSLTETEPAESNGGTITFTLGMTMQELERAAIAATLAAVNGNRRRASEKLGIGERTLYRKLKEYDIET